MSSTSRERRLSRRAKWIIFCVPLLVIVVALIGLKISGRRALSRAVREARAGGQPATMDEIIADRPIWAADQDAGCAFLALQPHLEDAAIVQVTDGPFSASLPILGQAKLPPTGYRWTDEQQTLAECCVTQMSFVLDELDELRRYEGGNLPCSSDPMNPDFALLSPLRFAAKLKALHAEATVMRGDASRLADDVAVVLRLGELLNDHPRLTSALLRMACESMAVHTVERALGVAHVSAPDLRRLESSMARAEACRTMYWAALGDRAFCLALADMANQGRTLSLPSVSSRAELLHSVPGWFDRDFAKALQMHNRLVLACVDRHIDDMAIAVQLGAEAAGFRAYVFPRIAFGSTERAYVLNALALADLRTARVGLAAERYRLKAGAFPERLDQLIPKYLPDVLLDPFDNRPMRYRVTDRYAVVYSIADNGIDDGGDVWGLRDRGKGEDCGFVVLRPEYRNLPWTQPASGPAD